MGECGCTSGCERFRFPGPKGIFYVVELYPGCKECCAPPGVTLYKIDKKHHLYRELQTDDYSQPLPWNKWDGGTEMPITAGLDLDDFRKVLCDEVTSYVNCLKEYGDKDKPRWIDKDDAFEMAEEIWQQAIHGSVSLVVADKIAKLRYFRKMIDGKFGAIYLKN